MNYRKISLLILAVAALARLTIALLFADIDPATANTWEHGTLAIAALQHGAIVGETVLRDGSLYVYPTAFMPPLFMFLWMGLFALLGVSKMALATVIALNIICGVLIVLMSMRICGQLFPGNSRASLLTGLVMALHPVFVFSVALYHMLNIYILFLLAVFYLINTTNRPSVRLAMLVGLLAGLAALQRTEYLFLCGGLMLWWAYRIRRVQPLLIATLCAGLIVGPWTLRNYLVLERFVPIANSVGYNLYKGFNPFANGSGFWVDNNRIKETYLADQLRDVPPGAGYENRMDDVYRRNAAKFMHENPGKAFMELPIRKVLLFWGYDIYDPKTHQFLYQIAFWPLFLLSAFGLYRASRLGLFRAQNHRSVLVLFGVQTFLIAGYAVHSRYRMNVEPILFCYAMAAVSELWAKLSAESGSLASS